MGRLAVIEELEKEQLKADIPQFSIGDTVKVHIRIIEGEKERVQVFMGTVIARKGTGVSETISVYRVSHGCSVEKVFLLHSPRIGKIEVARKGKVRRSKLYYLRGKQGKASRVKEKIHIKKVPAASHSASPDQAPESTSEEPNQES